MKKIFVLFVFLLIIPQILAININVEEIDSQEVVIIGLEGFAKFNLKVENLGPSDNFRFYNLIGFEMSPKETIRIDSNETKDIELIVYPREDLDYTGLYSFEYFIQGEDSSKISKELTLNIIELGDAFRIGSGEISPETNSIEIFIFNKVNFIFEDIDVKFTSAFFSLEESLSLGPNEKKSFSVQLNKEDFEKLIAGFYTLNADISTKGLGARVEGTIKFVEKDILTTTKRDYGLIINTQIIEKKNEGNVLASSETVIKKNIISRLFTSFSPEPDIIERNGFEVSYTWSRQVSPGETLKIIVKTNWLLPLLVILFLISIVILTKRYSKRDLVLKKKVSFVNAKGGEFALKVSILVNSKKHLERVSIIDKIPPLVKVYDRFGAEKPSRINEKNKRIEWELGDLESNESRVLSYIIYSKVGIMGKFALPEATAVYERDGEIHETNSNRAFFVAEQRSKDLD